MTLSRKTRLHLALALKSAAFLIPVILAVLLARSLGLERFMDGSYIDEHFGNNGFKGVTVYIGATAVLSLIGVPRMATALAGGYAFGPLAGTVYATLGNTASCAAAFFYARFFAHKALRKRFSRRIAKLDQFLSANPFSMTVAVRTFPAGVNSATSLLAGLTGISALPFIIGSAVGYLPQNIIFCLLGSGIRVDPFWRVLTATALFILSSGLGIYLFRKYRSGMKGAKTTVKKH